MTENILRLLKLLDVSSNNFKVSGARIKDSSIYIWVKCRKCGNIYKKKIDSSSLTPVSCKNCGYREKIITIFGNNVNYDTRMRFVNARACNKLVSRCVKDGMALEDILENVYEM